MLELVTVLAILVVLSAFSLPTVELSFVKGREKLLHERLTNIRRSIDRYVASRNGTGASVYPPCLASLTEPIPAPMLTVGADPGPFLDSQSLDNPFAGQGNYVLWDVKDKDGAIHADVKDSLQAIDVFDVSYPQNAPDNWSKALDDTLYKDW